MAAMLSRIFRALKSRLLSGSEGVSCSLNANTGDIENKRKLLPPEEGEVYHIELEVLQPFTDVKIGFQGKICLDYVNGITQKVIINKFEEGYCKLTPNAG